MSDPLEAGTGDPVETAVAQLRAGALVAYPTETLYGLGVDAGSAPALARLRRWKGRGEGQPVALLVPGGDALEALGLRVGPAARRLVEAFWPGPLTLVLPCTRTWPPGVARGDGAVGVRCSPHPVAAALAAALAQAGVGPATATSLNRSGRPPARSRDQALAVCHGGSDAPHFLDVPGGPEPSGAPSTVVDLTGPAPRVLRAGALSEEDVVETAR